jgi:F-type H+-transporting ATPase subunit b
MQFDWTTFILECINFLVLVWILKHFFYRPVLQVLDARQQRIHDETMHAEQLQQEAAALKQQYEARLSNWDREREQGRERLDQELMQLRTAGMEELKNSLANEAAKARARDSATVAAREAELIRKASKEAYRNTADMLGRLASPELTAKIARILQEDLALLPPDDQNALHKAGGALGEPPLIDIMSAHALEPPVKEGILASLTSLVGRPLQANFRVAPELIAGLRIAVGECVLHVNLYDELEYFQSRLSHARPSHPTS